ncbi:MAG: ATP-binding protein [Armatimonadetes bacterium]|nr:ATP-binding protein [Armatimonadota bacterium]
MRKTPDRVPTGNLTEAWGRFEPETPLVVGSPWWVDCHDARGGPDLVRRIALRVGRACEAGTFVHDLFTGHRGCGKSTELNRVADALTAEGLFVLSFDALDFLDPMNVEFGDVLLGIARRVVEDLARNDVRLAPALLDQVYAWFADRVETQVGIKKSEIEAAAGAELQGLPMLVKLFARLNTALRMGEESRTELRRVIREQIGVLTSRLNELLRSARTQLRRRDCRDLVVIVDNLDRISPAPDPALGGKSPHDVIFCDYGRQLVSLDCHTIYTVGVGLVLSHQCSQLSAIYGEVHHLPMVKLHTRGGAPFPPGCRVMEQVVTRRAKPELFESGALEVLCRESGGNPRDLVRLVRIAIEHRDEPPITMQAASTACQELTNEFRWLNDGQLQALRALDQSPQKTISMTDEEKLLLTARAILGYGNGDDWYDVHPAVRRMQRFRAVEPKADE